MSSGMDPLLAFLGEQPDPDWTWRFDHQATDETAVNAYALGNLAVLAYLDKADAVDYLTKSHLTEFQFFDGEGTQAILAKQDDSVFITFRGTEPLNFEEWLADINYNQRKLADQVPGRVHGGFADSLETIMGRLSKAVSSGSRLFITGHSLGGALAVLAAALFEMQLGVDVSAVYTYGQPRVGDKVFSSAYDQVLGNATFRYVNDLDLVPHVPPENLPVPIEDIPSQFFSGGSFIGLENAEEAVQSLTMGEGFAHVGQLRLFIGDEVSTNDSDFKVRELFSGSVTDFISDGPALLRFQLDNAFREPQRLLDHDPTKGYLPKLKKRLS
jgi:triacylglycerol lipase